MSNLTLAITTIGDLLLNEKITREKELEFVGIANLDRSIPPY